MGVLWLRNHGRRNFVNTMEGEEGAEWDSRTGAVKVKLLCLDLTAEEPGAYEKPCHQHI